MDKSWFSTYSVSEELKLGINTSIISKIFGCIKPNTQKIEFSSENLDKLTIRFINNDEENGGNNIRNSNYEFEMPLMDINKEDMVIPDIVYSIDMCINSQEMRDLYEEISGFDNDVGVVINDDKIEFNTDGENGKIKIVVKDEHLDELSIEEELGILTQTFSIDKLRKIFKFHKLSESVNIHLKKDIPMKILFNMDKDKNEETTGITNDIEFEDDSEDDFDDSEDETKGDIDVSVDQSDEIKKPKNFIGFYLAPKFV